MIRNPKNNVGSCLGPFRNYLGPYSRQGACGQNQWGGKGSPAQRQHAAAVSRDALHLKEHCGFNIGKALIIRIGFWGPLHYT